MSASRDYARLAQSFLLFTEIMRFIVEEDDIEDTAYKIVSFKENYNNTNKIAVKLQIKNSSRSFFVL